MIEGIEYPKPLVPVPTWYKTDPSKMKTFMDCGRQYFFEYVLGWRSTAPNNHLVFGQAWHDAMEHLLRKGYGAVDEAVFIFMNSYRKELPPDTDALYDPKTPSRADEALRDYVLRFASDLSEFEVMHTEISGTVLITPQDMMYFRMDTILKEISEKQMIFSLDHKTGSRKGRTWTDKFFLDMSTGLYTHVMYCLYPKEQVKGVKIRGTFFYKTKLEYEEVPVWRSEQGMQVWLWNCVYWYNLMKWNFNELSRCKEDDEVLMAFPMNTESCTKYFGCAYHDFCTAWHNPLRNCEEPPLGFKIDHWDPTEGESKYVVEL